MHIFEMAVADGFETCDIAEAVRCVDYHFLLVPDEVMPAVFDQDIRPLSLAGERHHRFQRLQRYLRFPQVPGGRGRADDRTEGIGTGVRKTFGMHGLPEPGRCAS